MKTLYLVALTLLLGFLVTPASALLSWSWDYDQPHVQTTPNEFISIYITIFNDSSSDEVLPVGTPFVFYTLTEPTWSLYYDLSVPSMDYLIEPGDSLSAEFMRLTPIAPAPIGSEFTIDATIMPSLTLIPDLGIQTVGPNSMLQVSVIPEPSSFALFGLGTLALAIKKKRRTSGSTLRAASGATVTHDVRRKMKLNK